MKLLTGARASFTAVGDDDQSIYGWRGADIENLRLLRDDYPQPEGHQAGAELPLDDAHPRRRQQRHRQQPQAVRQEAVVGQRPRRRDPGRRLPRQRARGRVGGRAPAGASLRASRQVVRLRRSSIAATTRRAPSSSNCARSKIPYVLSGGQSFFDSAEIKDITSYLRLLANQDDDPAFIRAVTTPKRGIGGTTLEALGRAAGQAPPEPVRRHLRAGHRDRTHRQAARRAARVRQLHQPHRVPRRQGTGRPGAGRPAARDRLRDLAVRDAGPEGGRDQVGQRARLRRLAGQQGRRRRTRTCSNWRRPWR